MVTAEMAVGLLSAAVLVVMAAWGIGLAAMQIRAMDAAAQVARAEARGDHTRAAELLRQSPGAHVTTSRLAGRVSVTVTMRADGLGPLLPARDMEATAVADLEPGES